MLNASRILLPVLFLSFSLSALCAEKRYPADTVVAKRGDAVVTMLDIDAVLLGVPERMRANVMNNPKRIEELIDRLLINRQMAIEGKALKLDQDAVFKRATQQQEERLLSEQKLLDLRGKIDLGDVEELAHERYLVNPDAYTVAGTTTARHILIGNKNRSDAEALKLAGEVRAKAESGEDFVALVKKYSDDPSKETNEGLIPNADSSSMAPQFAAAVKELKKPGEISPVTKTQFGYHIIMLRQRTEAKPRSFAEVKQEIMAEIDNSLRGVRVQEHVDELKSMTLDAEPDVVASLRTRYLPEGAVAEPMIPETKK